MKKRLFYLSILLLIFGCTNHSSTNWDFKTFYKPSYNPVLKADSFVGVAISK